MIAPWFIGPRGRHYLFVREYDYAALEKFVRGYCRRCMGNSWAEVAQKLAHLGYWEFENYTEFPAWKDWLI